MRKLLPIVASLMLALVLFSGTRAHAAEAAGVAETEIIAHFEGDGDQAPADEHGPAPHHHGLCHADHVGIAADLGARELIGHAEVAPLASGPLHLPSASLGAALRPPIA
jgi:hypothetical protein